MRRGIAGAFEQMSSTLLYADHVAWWLQRNTHTCTSEQNHSDRCELLLFGLPSSFSPSVLAWIGSVSVGYSLWCELDSTGCKRARALAHTYTHINQRPNESNKRLTWTFVTVTMPFHNDCLCCLWRARERALFAFCFFLILLCAPFFSDSRCLLRQRQKHII